MTVSGDHRPPRADLLHRLHRIGSTFLSSDVADLINYSDTPHGAVAHDFLAGAHRNLALLVQYLGSDAEPTGYDIGPLVAIAMKRHREGIPLHDILNAYQRVTDAVWQRVLASTTTDEQAVLSTFTPRIVGYFTLVTSTITAACHTPGEPGHGADPYGRHAVAQALIEGSPPPAIAVLQTLGIPQRFVVAEISLATAASSDDSRAVLDTLTDLDSYLVANENGWTVLVPADEPPDIDARHLEELLDAHRTSDANVFVGGAAVAEIHGDIPAAVATARHLHALNGALGSVNTVVGATDLLLALTVRGSREIPQEMRRLRHALDRLDDGLRATLIGFLTHNCNQLATAQDLHLHRNTVTYRLARVAMQTGMNPLKFADAAALYAALALPDEPSSG